MDLISQMNTFVIWGHNPIVSWPNTWHYIADAMEYNDCKLIVVDPNKNTIGQKADLFISVQPGTDAALALGLADEMQAAAGGLRLDVLFVDEGFGSLDEEALELAIRTLSGLAEGNKLVGIISHVSELKESIDKKIIVKKGSAGSSIAWQE